MGGHNQSRVMRIILGQEFSSQIPSVLPSSSFQGSRLILLRSSHQPSTGSPGVFKLQLFLCTLFFTWGKFSKCLLKHTVLTIRPLPKFCLNSSLDVSPVAKDSDANPEQESYSMGPMSS